MTRSDMNSRVRVLREELENRHKYGTVKLAKIDGSHFSSEELQAELYSLVYKLSKLE